MISSAILVLVAGVLPAGDAAPIPDEVVLLSDCAPCGLASLYLVTRFRDMGATWERVKELVGPPAADGTHSFADLSRAAAQLGMHPVGLQVRREALARLPMPAIVQVRDVQNPEEPHHLLLLLRPERDGVTLMDPPYPAYFLPEAQFEQSWTGNVLVFAPDAQEASEIQAEAASGRITAAALWVWVGSGVTLFTSLLLLRWRSRLVQGLYPRTIHLLRGSRGIIRLALRPAGVVLLLLILGIPAFWWFQRQWAASHVPPRCIFDQALLELGELKPGHVSVPVGIANAGSAPLQISGVASTCTCAVVKAPEVIGPGEHAVMQVDLNIVPGRRTAQVTVESNDPEGPKHLVLAWHGAARPNLLPRRILEPSAAVGRPYERTIRLVYPGGRSAVVPRLARVECPSPRVTIREGKNDRTATRLAVSGGLVDVVGELELRVSVQPPPEPELLETYCKLHVKYGETESVLYLLLSVRFLGSEITPEVPAVVFSAPRMPALVGQERLVPVTVPDDMHDLTVQDVPPWLDCRVLPKAGKAFPLRVKVCKLPPEPVVRHTLHLGSNGVPSRSTPLRVCTFASMQPAAAPGGSR
jgi:hypothetical protein